jgi:Uncharacterized alpha/beta hydrolase domain (DUF2235)
LPLSLVNVILLAPFIDVFEPVYLLLLPGRNRNSAGLVGIAMDEKVELTPKQKNSLHHAVDNPMLPPAFALTGDINPNMRVFVVNFDGTQNDKDNIPDGSIATLVANSHQYMSTSDKLVSKYYSGVGTRANAVRGFLESVTGMGASSRAEQAYKDLCEQTIEWRKQNPNCEVHVHVVGFSRGSGIGLHFMNLVHERGIKTNGNNRAKEPGLMPGEVKTSAVLMDAVTTGNSNMKLTLPDSNIATLHITAGAEERRSFPLTTLKDPDAPDDIAMAKGVFNGSTQDNNDNLGYKRLQEISLDGARHSDVGGSYPQGGIRQVSAYLMGEFQRHLGLPVYAKKPTFEEIEGMHANDSRFKVNKIVDPFMTEDERIAARQNAHRNVISRGERVWDGDVAIKCGLKDGDGESFGFERYEHCMMSEREPLSGQEIAAFAMAADNSVNALTVIDLQGGYVTNSGEEITLEDFTSTTELTLKKPSAETPADRLFHGLEVVGTNAAHLSVSDDGDTMMYHGIKLPKQFSLTSIRGLVEESTNNQLTVCVGFEKTTPVYEVNHKPTSWEQVKQTQEFIGALSFQDDPWPAVVRDAIYKLNDPHGLVTDREAKMMKYRALESLSSKLLKDFGKGSKSDPSSEFIHPDHKIESIELRSHVIGNRQGKLSIEIKRADGSVIRDTDVGKTGEDFMYLTEMQSIQKAMNMLDDRLYAAGHLTARPIHQVFSKDTEWDLADKTMPDKNKREITAKELDVMHRSRPAIETGLMTVKRKDGQEVVFSVTRKPTAVPALSMIEKLGSPKKSCKANKPNMMH